MHAANEELRKVTQTLRENIDCLKTHDLPQEVTALREQRDKLKDTIRRALRELGVPQPGYPAPVANAVEILNDVL